LHALLSKETAKKLLIFYKDIFDGELTQFRRFSDAPEGAFEYPEYAKNLVIQLP